MSWIYTILASLVEGFTEFLPISSTGHLIVLNHLLKIQDSDIISSFNIFIQLGAILAVLNLYYQDLLKDKKILLNILISFIPTAIIGFTLYPLIKRYLLSNLLITTASLFLGGILIFLLPKTTKSKEVNLLGYFKIGIFQSLSVIPGTSRALMSIIGGLFSGLNMEEAVRYSFLLAIPTIGAATGLDLIKNKEILLQNINLLPFFLLGFTLSFVTAKLTLKYFLGLVKNNSLKFFGYYRIALALLIYLVLLR